MLDLLNTARLPDFKQRFGKAQSGDYEPLDVDEKLRHGIELLAVTSHLKDMCDTRPEIERAAYANRDLFDAQRKIAKNFILPRPYLPLKPALRQGNADHYDDN